MVIWKGYIWESSHFMREEDQNCWEKRINSTGSMIIIPDAGTLHANKHSSVPLQITLSPTATITIIVPFLKSYYMFHLDNYAMLVAMYYSINRRCTQ